MSPRNLRRLPMQSGGEFQHEDTSSSRAPGKRVVAGRRGVQVDKPRESAEDQRSVGAKPENTAITLGERSRDTGLLPGAAM